MNDTKDVETWENVSAGTVYVNRFVGDGHAVQQERVSSGRKVILTPQERTVLNSERAYAETADPFFNGTLRPIMLAEDSSDLAENPNHMSEADLRKLYATRNYKKFKASIDEISALPILSRMLELADEDDEDRNDSINATVKQREVVVDRLSAVSENDVSEVIPVGSGVGTDDDRNRVQKFRSE